MIPDLKPYSATRDSYVPSLGEVPGHWEVLRLKNWLDVNRAVLTEDTDPDYRFDYLDIGAVAHGHLTAKPERIRFGNSPSRARRVVRCGDTLVSTVRPYLKAVWHAEEPWADLVASTGFAVLTPRTGTVPKFVSYFCQSNPFTNRVTAESVGTAYPAVSEASLGNLEVCVPPLPEQAAIARFLDDAERRIRCAITAKEKLIALLEEQKQAVIHQAVTGGLDAASDGPPPHWKRLALRAATESIQTGPFGSQLHQSDYVTGGVPVVNPAHLVGGSIESSPDVTVTDEKASQLGQHRLRPGDVVIARRGEMGRCAVVTEENADWLCGTGSVRIRPDAAVLVAPYLVSVLGSAAGRRALTEVSIGTTMNNLSATAVGSVRLSLPPVSEQRAIARYLEEKNAAVEVARRNIREQIGHMREYRTRLIADVVTGKLDVREAAAQLQTGEPPGVSTTRPSRHPRPPAAGGASLETGGPFPVRREEHGG